MAAPQPDPPGLDGAAPFAAMARAHSGCDVWQQIFRDRQPGLARVWPE